MKKFIAVFLAALLVCGSCTAWAEEGQEKMSMDDISFGEPYDYGNVLYAANLVRGTATMQDGRPIGLTVVPGTPTMLNIVDLNTMTRIEAIEVPNTNSACWFIDVNKYGDVYFGSYLRCHFYKYSPTEKKLYDFGRVLSESAVTALDFDEEGNPYMGTYPNAKLIKFDIKTQQYIDLGSMTNSDQYLNGVSYYKGKVYYQHNENHGLYCYDINTKEKTEIPFDDPSYGGTSRMMVRGDKLIMVGSPMKVYDLEKQEWFDSVPGVNGQFVTPLYEDGKTFYMFKDGYAHSYNIETKEVVKLENLPYGSFMRGGGILFELDDPEFSGLNYFSIQYNGRVQVWNFQNQKARDVSGLLTGVPTETRSFGFGPDGRFYVGEYMGTQAAALDLETREIEIFHMAQPESFTTLNDKMYFGNYTGAELYILDTSKPYDRLADRSNPENNPRIWGYMGEGQDRPFASLATEDKVVFGSVPTYGEFGGAISIYDPETDTVDSYRHLVKDQMPVSLAYRDGLLYVGTSVSGGLGKTPTETQAKVFIFDMEKREVIKCVDMKIPGVTADIKGVEGLSIAPDNTLVGYGRGYMYKMDMETLELLDYRVWGKVDYGNGAQIWKPNSIIYDKSGYAFMSFDGKLAIVDYETLDYKVTDTAMSSLAVQGPDGNLYQIGSGYKVNMVPVIRGNDYSHKYLGRVLFEPGNNNAFVNGKLVAIDANDVNVVPYTKNDRMMVPLRFLAENLGYKVTYNDFEGTALIYNDDVKIKVKEGAKDYTINGEAKKLVVSPEITNDRLFVHSRTFAEMFGKDVYWDESDLVVINLDGTKFDPVADAEVIKYADQYLGGASIE